MRTVRCYSRGVRGRSRSWGPRWALQFYCPAWPSLGLVDSASSSPVRRFAQGLWSCWMWSIQTRWSDRELEFLLLLRGCSAKPNWQRRWEWCLHWLTSYLLQLQLLWHRGGSSLTWASPSTRGNISPSPLQWIWWAPSDRFAGKLFECAPIGLNEHRFPLAGSLQHRRVAHWSRLCSKTKKQQSQRHKHCRFTQNSDLLQHQPQIADLLLDLILLLNQLENLFSLRIRGNYHH